MRSLTALLIGIGLTGGAGAQEWEPLRGVTVEIALTDRVLQYEGATQKFFASGRTLYTSVRDSWGYSAVRGDAYCSQWPPSDGWACYKVERATTATGDVTLRFLSEDGSSTEGLYLE
ncbi:hypothetical protein [Litoreibacter roseus]|uniref:Uncharacterized protein n=1 Tax=Litoreibacter roseus TaxID=2601869 RepID=A0A6N6JHP2_9RHOB|nr:hypothetical protein [Litoreibacter roseus]GFE65851.1 hypothetical protein KIN_29250 [Litoreibacter roseus]